MFRAAFGLFCACSLTLLPLRADFTYQQTSRVTGGSMMRMMKMVPGGGKALEPTTSTVSIKGNRMATASARTIHIVDLDAETMTDVDLEKKTYSVMTFADLRKLMSGMQQGSSDSAQVDARIDVKKTGQSKVIQNLSTQETILTVIMDMKDPKSGQTAQMTMTSDMWLAKNVPGYEEVRAFQRRMAEKLAFDVSMLRMGRMGAQPGMGQGMAKLASEGAKLDGVPVLSVVKMGGMGGPGAMPGQPPAQSPSGTDLRDQAARDASRTASEDAARETSRATGGRFGGLAGAAAGGMLGGLGRRRQQQSGDSQPTPQPSTAPAPGAAPAAGGGDAFMETTTELTSFAAGAVDGSVFAIPAGFKQVDSEMKRMAR